MEAKKPDGGKSAMTTKATTEPLEKKEATDQQPSQQAPQKSGEPDCTALDTLTVEAIRENIETRFGRTPQEIYTWVGVVLLSVNPYTALENYYNDDMKKYYLEANLQTMAKFPHIYAVGQACYQKTVSRRSMEGRQNLQQAVVITGESGSGKTEACRQLLSFFTFASLNAQRGSATTPSPPPENASQSAVATNQPAPSPLSPHSIMSTVESALISAGLILEVFGSAKTLINDNSSRFGRLTEVFFDEFGRIEFAQLKTFLLAKSRVTNLIKGEQNFTALHVLVCGMNDDAKRAISNSENHKTNSSFPVRPQEEYKYLNGISKSSTDIPDHLNLQAIEDCFNNTGISTTEQQDIWRTLLGILELGNLEFEYDEKEERTKIIIGNEVGDDNQLKLICTLLGIESATEFGEKLTTQTILNQCCRHLTIEKVRENRDSMARLIYEKLFDFLVKKVNSTLQTYRRRVEGAGSTASSSSRQISIWDMYGFELEPVNSFDQLCINYANECLLELFSQHTICKEQELYENEGLPRVKIDEMATGIMASNKEVIEFMDSDHQQASVSLKTSSGSPFYSGIFQILNDVNILSSEDGGKRFIESVVSLQSKRFKGTMVESSKGKYSSTSSTSCFGIRHTFHPVLYTATVRKERMVDGLKIDMYMEQTIII